METLDKATPGGVYLCQINECISCGACCGLYNILDPSLDNMVKILEYRTELYEKTPRDFDSLLEFQEIINKKENDNRPFPEFHHCQYIGFIGDSLKRPGCLLHPLGKGNNNVDHRGLSHWGGLACATYFCPTCSQLPVRYKKILRICAENWYIYGLIVTETRMLESFFNYIEEGYGSELEPEKFINNQEIKRSVLEFFQLKTDWKFRPKNFNKLGNYFFKDNLYPPTSINYKELNTSDSKYNEILLALGSEFNSRESLQKAELIITNMLNKIISQFDNCM